VTNDSAPVLDSPATDEVTGTDPTEPLEPTATAAEPADGATAADPPGGRPPLRRLAGWISWGGASVVLAAATLAMAVIGHGHDQVQHARAAAVARVDDLIPQIFSYDYQHVDEQLAATFADFTGPFQSQFKGLATSTVAPAAKQSRVTVKATVTETGIVSAGTNRVTVLVFLNQSTTVAGNDQAQVSGSRLQVVLQHVGSRWLISTIAPV
jgi:Mce-associated membrane protein